MSNNCAILIPVILNITWVARVYHTSLLATNRLSTVVPYFHESKNGFVQATNDSTGTI